MEKTVKSCSECLFYDERAMNPYFSIKMCRHPDNKKHLKISESIIHPNCPEKGPFIITTKKIEDETTTI